MKTLTLDAGETFMSCGACSHTFCYILNDAFDKPNEDYERAADLLAGGILSMGQQCGMLWGAALAVGAESYRREQDHAKAIPAAIIATQHLLESFAKITGTLSCHEITNCDLTTFGGLVKLGWKTFRKGMKKAPCIMLASAWGPEAVKSADEGLQKESEAFIHTPISCASEVARKMGAPEEEMSVVAGFAGGLGLSGNGCGALSAAIWMYTLNWCRENPGKTPAFFKNPGAKEILNAFQEATGGELTCVEICGRVFETLDEHSAFVREGGCADLLALLANSATKN